MRRRAAGDDDARVGAFAMQAADGLARLARRLRRDGAGVDDDEIFFPGAARLARERLRFDDVEPTAEGDGLDARSRSRRQPLENGGIERRFEFEFDRPGHVHVIVVAPVNEKIAAGKSYVARDAPRENVRAAATSVAQAAEPQALVAPVPRSQTRSRISSSGQNLREGDVRALGKERMTLQHGAELFEIDRAGVVDEKHRVRIAHADGAKPRRRARDWRLQRDIARVANVARQRNLATRPDAGGPCRR